MMRRVLPWAAYFVVFLLTIQVLYPHLCPWDDTIPSRELVEDEQSYARQEWLDGLAFETILDDSLKRFGKPQLHNLYLGGGYLIAGDPRDGTVNPLTWALIWLDALARMKLKIVISLMAAFFSTIVLARRMFSCGWAAAGVTGLLALILLRFWPSLIETPLDSGILLGLPAVVILWTHRGRLMNVGIAGMFVALATMQTGAAWMALVLAFLLIGLSLGLNRQSDGPPHPIRDSIIVLSFALMFGAVKFLPMAEAVPSLRAFWTYPVEPVLRISAFINEPLLPLPFPVVFITTLLCLFFWISIGSRGIPGALAVAIFAILSIAPDWGTFTGGMFGHSSLPGPFDSPGRYFYPFFVLFISASFGGAAVRFSQEVSGHILTSITALVSIAILIGVGATQMAAFKWAPLDAPYNFLRFQNPENPDFFQIKLPREKRDYKLPDSLHPAILATQRIGANNPKMLYDFRSRTVPKVHFKGKSRIAVKVHRYRKEFSTTSKRLNYTHIEDWGNRIEIEAQAKRPGYFVLNRNYDENWHISDGELTRHRGKLAINVKKPGDYAFSLVYYPFSLILGIFITAFTILAFLIFIFPQKSKNF